MAYRFECVNYVSCAADVSVASGLNAIENIHYMPLRLSGKRCLLCYVQHVSAWRQKYDFGDTGMCSSRMNADEG